jgi:hypothetical protein
MYYVDSLYELFSPTPVDNMLTPNSSFRHPRIRLGEHFEFVPGSWHYRLDTGRTVASPFFSLG